MKTKLSLFVYVFFAFLQCSCNKDKPIDISNFFVGYYPYDYYTDTIIKYFGINICGMYSGLHFYQKTDTFSKNFFFKEDTVIRDSESLDTICLSRTENRKFVSGLSFKGVTLRDSNTALNRIIFSSKMIPHDLNEDIDFFHYQNQYRVDSLEYLKLYWNDSILKFIYIISKVDTQFFNTFNTIRTTNTVFYPLEVIGDIKIPIKQ